MAIKLVSVADVRAYLNFSSTNQDTLITELIEQVSENIQNYCDRIFTRAVDEVEYPKGGSSIISLKRFPIESIADIRYDTNREFGTDTIVESDDYSFLGDYGTQGLVWREYYGWWAWPLSIKVTYTGGYTDTAGVLDVPDDLKKACTMQVAYLFDRRRNAGASAITGQEGSVSLGGEYDLLDNVKAMLTPHRRFTVV